MKLFKRIINLSLLTLLIVGKVNSQAVICPSVNAQIGTGPSTTICQGNCATLTASVTPVNETTTYSVSQIGFAPQPTVGATNVVLSDDSQTGALPIGFTFCFFGNSYTQFYIGSNGWISFSAGQSNAFTSAGIPNLAANVPKNCIMGPWQDWHPGIAGGPYIRYQTLGTAPCRRLVVTWNNCPMFSCTTTYGTFQIIIYETTNIIENHITNKPNCLAWANGTAVQGIHNLPGTIGITVPGRNSTQWTTTNNAWRWTPNGAPTYTINWVGPTGPIGTSSQVVVCPLTTGVYTANATVGGCVANTNLSNTVQVIVSPIPTLTVNSPTVCSGTNATLTATGAQTYTWQPGNLIGSSVVYTPITTSIYTVTGTTSLGCISTQTAQITVNSSVTASITSGTIACYGGVTSATANPVGGTGPYTYTWNSIPVQNTQVVNNLPIGNYTVTVNSLGCIATASITITQPTSLTIVPSQTDVTCFGGNDGSASVIVSGGTGPYTYSWSTSPIQSSPTATSLSMGSYSCTVTDANGCIMTTSIVINQPIQITVPTNQINTTCGLPNGSATANPVGGTGPYTYLWSNGQTTQTAINLLAGPYTVTVTSVNGCTATASVNLLDSGAPIVTIPTTTNVSCFGDNSGSANSNLVGGVGPFTYTWNSIPVQNTPNATNLIAGNYTLTVTGSNGCSTTSTVTITQPTQLVSSITTTNVSCFGGNDGSAMATPIGGVGPYTYTWTTNPIQNTQVATNLSSGTYSCTITDLNGCQIIVSANITQPTQLVSSILSQTNISCFGGNNGVITTSVNGGVGPNYLYSLNAGPNQLSPIFNGLTAGTHTIMVTDQNGCNSITTTTLVQPPTLIINGSVNNILCFNTCNGQASVNVGGGTPGYTYNWSNGGTTNPIVGLCVGNYSVMVTDLNGCQITLTGMSVNQPSPLTISPNVLPTTICVGQSSNLISNVNGGVTPYTYTWSNGATISNITVSPTVTTNYTVNVTDANGCNVSNIITVVVNPELTGLASSIPSTICAGETSTISANANGGTGGPYTFNWSPGGIGQSINVTPNTTTIYTVTISDGCSQVVTYTTDVKVNSLPIVEYTTSKLKGCEPLVVTYSNTTSNSNNCIWTINGVPHNNCVITHTFPTQGTYTSNLTVTDINGCTAIGNSVVTNVYPIPVAAFTTTPSIVNISSPIVTFNNISSNGSYQWNFGDGTTSTQLYPTHTYGDIGTFTVQLTVTTSHGCINTTYGTVYISDIFSIYVPNTFTPNGDGVNETFTPIVMGYEFYEFWIFDRWGEMIYYSTDTGMPWDATYKGKIVQDGVYVWKVHAKEKETAKHHNLTGHVTLLK